MNENIISAMISTCLHIKAESSRLTRTEILDTAASLKKASASLYPVTDKEWDGILKGIARYADCLV